MSDRKPLPWAVGNHTKAVLDNRAAAEQFAHLTYGELVKHFGLGTTHTFSSWNQLPDDEREKWIAAFTEVHGELADRAQARTEINQSQMRSH